jgi:3-deoxy-D-manno-octulosonate 8-phosphate phosphatase (KDO 8-P phosphatase)
VERIRAVLLDVDGVLTDGTFRWGPDGAEWKSFCFADVMGISRARRGGLLFALVSGEDSPLVDRFAAKTGIETVYKGCKDKAAALLEFGRRHSLRAEAVCFMGNDINDVAAMRASGLSAAPADAEPAALREAKFVAARPGGHGAVRDLLEWLVPASFA